MLDARRRRTPGRETEKAAPGVNSGAEGVDFRIFSPKICLIFVGWGGNFEFLRGLHHTGIF